MCGDVSPTDGDWLTSDDDSLFFLGGSSRHMDDLEDVRGSKYVHTSDELIGMCT